MKISISEWIHHQHTDCGRTKHQIQILSKIFSFQFGMKCILQRVVAVKYAAETPNC